MRVLPTHSHRQNRTSVSRYRPARGTDIRSRVARAPGQEPRSTRRGDSAGLHSGRSWAFGNRHRDPGRTAHDGPSRPGGTVCSVPSHLVAAEMTRRPAAAASGRVDTTVPGPATPGRRRARPDHRARLTHPRSSSSEPERLPGTAVPPARDGVALAACSMPPPVPVSHAPGRAGSRAAMPMPAGPGRDGPCSEARSRQRTANR
jgi:hypothetical protein